MKAILVLDRMPTECSECPCFYDYLHCQAQDGVNVLGDERPYNCPLKPMPEEKHRKTNNDIAGAIDYGWNSCLLALEGKDMVDKAIDSLNEAIETAKRILAEREQK